MMLPKKEPSSRFQQSMANLLNERDLEEDRVGTSVEPSQYQSKEETIRTCTSLFNEQKTGSATRHWNRYGEGRKKGDERDVQQGIILAASALVHFQRNEDKVCLGMIPRALAKLDKWSEDKYYSFDVGKLKRYLREMDTTKVIVTPTI